MPSPDDLHLHLLELGYPADAAATGARWLALLPPPLAAARDAWWADEPLPEVRLGAFDLAALCRSHSVPAALCLLDVAGRAPDLATQLHAQGIDPIVCLHTSPPPPRPL